MSTSTDVWSLSDMPDQAGRTTVVTGCTTGGLGYFTALELARRGGRVVLAGRSTAKLGDAATAIRRQVPAAELLQMEVDLADLGSVRKAAAHAHSIGPIDVLVNNAGVMAPPYERTVDGLEIQMATNHFGPFLFTGLLLPQLVASQAARVVTVSSPMHRVARKPPLGDPFTRKGRYAAWQVYGQTKLANLLFTYELDRRCRDAELPVKALAAHPGSSGTHLMTNRGSSRARAAASTILDAAFQAFSQSAHMGALPTLMAATEDLPGGTYCGPSGLSEVRGLPVVVGSTKLSRDESVQRAMWELSEKTVGLDYP